MAQTGNLSNKFIFFKDPNHLNFTWISQELTVLTNCSLLHTATGEVSLSYCKLVLKLVWADSTKQRQRVLSSTPALPGHSCCPGKSSDQFFLTIWTQTKIFFYTLFKKAAKAISLCRCLKVLYFKIVWDIFMVVVSAIRMHILRDYFRSSILQKDLLEVFFSRTNFLIYLTSIKSNFIKRLPS